MPAGSIRRTPISRSRWRCAAPASTRTDIELVADPTLPPGTNASRLEVVSDSGELKIERLGRSMPDNPKTGVLTALTMADDLMKIVRSSDW